MTPARRDTQRGATLIIALIMLVALAMLSAWAFNGSQMNMRVVGNSQARQEVVGAAQAAIELTISSQLFAADPAAVAASAIPIDVDGDALPDYQVQLSPPPSCYRVRVLKVNELDPGNAGDRACLGSSGSPNPGIETAGSTPPTGDSLCADSEWNLRAVVTDPRSNANAAVNQGVAIRSLSTDAANACP
jgi:type IV pilus assembly PilX-like protein